MLDKSTPVEEFRAAEMLPSPEPWMRLGWGVVAGGMAVAMGLAIALKVNVRVRSPGVIRPEQAIQVVEAGISSTVASIEVAPNDTVAAGQTIAVLQDANLPRLQRQRAQAERDRDAAQQEHQVILAQREALRFTILADAEALSSHPLPDDSAAALEAALARLVDARPQTGRDRLTAYRQIQEAQATAQQTLQQRQEALDILEQQIQQRQLVAPTAGVISQLHLQNPGQQVQPGMVVAQIIPADSPLVVQAEVSPRDIGRVEVGHQAQIRVAAYPYPDYGNLTGAVRAIAPDARPCQQPTCPSPTTYQVTLSLDADAMTRGDRTYALQPGMDVTADIISRQERFVTLLLRRLRLVGG